MILLISVWFCVCVCLKTHSFEFLELGKRMLFGYEREVFRFFLEYFVSIVFGKAALSFVSFEFVSVFSSSRFICIVDVKGFG